MIRQCTSAHAARAQTRGLSLWKGSAQLRARMRKHKMAMIYPLEGKDLCAQRLY